MRLKKMVTEQPSGRLGLIWGPGSPWISLSRQTALEKHGPILQNKLIYREKKE